MPPRRLPVPYEERVGRAIQRMADGSLAGRSRSAEPVRPRRSLIQGGLGAVTGHTHMGTGVDSTVISGLFDSVLSLAGGFRSYGGADGAVANGQESIALGYLAFTHANALDSVAIGPNAQSDHPYGVAVGYFANLLGNDAVTGLPDLDSSYSVAIGYTPQARGPNNVALGTAAAVGYVSTTDGVNTAFSSSEKSIAIGYQAACVSHTPKATDTTPTYDQANIAIGALAKVRGNNLTLVSPPAKSNYSVAFGYNAQVNGADYAMAIGANAVCSTDHTIVIGTALDTVVIPGTISGGGGGTTITFVTSDPSGAPAAGTEVRFNTTNNTWWVWNSVSAAWKGVELN